ncbi:6-hydroxy-d-nicotine oxidase [Colletotrichum truncatum]|uniref:6-hydroxy-d-nicotine oxidase n=1 Tax=Colletotrichum truncatum TaxID=5467 RepID=A0ACC3YRP8_COLTU|nr:6-hydroxy-d-nicotine oxidase [Colletotrichum truncatum]KAF6799308.1 6-hydroxy-d-nicotine oxidase [Colletotrichum truncatum]
MTSLEAAAEFRVVNPKASTSEQVASDAPQLRNISESLPDLLIYTSSVKSFEEVSPFYNAAVKQRPLAVIRPRTADEVAAVVREMRSEGIPFGIRSGGHDMVAAQAQGKDGVIVDLRGLDSVVIAEDQRSVRVGGGTPSINLSKFLHTHRLLTPHGWCATVGITGWALGGGYGYLSAFYGLGVDQILGARVVLASGEVVDTDDHPDLLWALRGAGNGNFGIVVELRLKLYPETGFLGGLLGFSNSQAAEVLKNFLELEKDLPVNFSGEALQTNIPGVGPLLAWLFVWTSDDDNLEDGWAFHQKLKALGTPLLDTVAEVDDYTFFNEFPRPAGNHLHPRLSIVESFTEELGKVMEDYPPPGPLSCTVIHSFHGRALQENPAACYPLRNRHHILNPVASLPDPSAYPADFEECKQWADGLIGEVANRGLALPYGNRNLSPETDMNWVATYGEETLARLKEIKNKFDPDNVYRTGYPRLGLV